MHGFFGQIANHIGDDAETVKDTLKGMFLEKVEHTNMITGEVTLRPKSTTKLTIGEMAEFMQKIEAFANSQLGLFFKQKD